MLPLCCSVVVQSSLFIDVHSSVIYDTTFRTRLVAYEELVDFLSTFLSKNQKDSICIGVLRFQNDVQSKLSKSVESGDLDDALKLVRTLDVANYVLSMFGCLPGTSQ